MAKGYKYPQKDTCVKCCGFIGKCTYYSKEEWVELWLTNQCERFEKK